MSQVSKKKKKDGQEFDVNNMLKNIKDMDVLTPEKAMEFLSSIILGKVKTENGTELNMYTRLKATQILKDYYRDLKPVDKSKEVTKINVTFNNLEDTDRVKEIASECGISEDELNDIKEKSKEN